jgi:predicted dehydrogenase
MHLFGGRPERVRAWGKSCLHHDIEDVVVIDLHFPSDIWVCIQCSWYEPIKTRNMTIVGSKQMLMYDELPSEDKIVLYRRGFAPTPSQTDRFGNQDFSLYDEGLFMPRIDWKEPLRIECNHFLNCILNGEKPLSDGRDGRNTLEVINAVNKSLQHNGEEIRLA